MTRLAARKPDEAKGLSPPPSPIKIGADVLELLSTAMYVDPRTLFREYIQNAADALDDAVRDGILDRADARVDVTLDPRTRTILIRDNGSGLESEVFYSRLTALGASAKRGSASRGFRGIGRLSGLGYARELILRSRVAGGQVNELVWDCRELRALLRDADHETGLAAVIEQCTRYRILDDADMPERFFEVELRGVVRLRNDVLLNEQLVHAYLSEACPLPFSPDFSFAADVEDCLKGRIAMGDVRVFLNDAEEPVYRPHRDRRELPDGRALNLVGIEPVELFDRNGEISALGWIAHHDYVGAVPTPMNVKGVRLRCGNMQIGSHDLLEEMFKEERFNSWIVGELHVLDERIIPNARRDNFEQNSAWTELGNQFLPIARRLSDLCRNTSIRRNWQKRVELATKRAEENLNLVEEQTFGTTGHRFREAAEIAIVEAREALSSRFLTQEDRDELSPNLNGLEERLLAIDPPKADASPFEHLPAQERAIHERLFSLIYECAPSNIVAEELVGRMLERIRE